MICYVILHYQDLNMTKKCIDSLLSVTNDSMLIVVDNASPNGSGKVLLTDYCDQKRIIVLLNKENEGFAFGNNVGYLYAKEKFAPEIIVVMNNDIIIDDDSFENKLYSCFRNNEIDLMGPDIVTPIGNHQNPLAYYPLSTECINKRIKVDRIKIKLLKYDIFFTLYNYYKKKHPVPLRKEAPEVSTDCILHGSCMAYGKRYISQEDFAFLPVTYMYNEESILYDYLKYKGYKTMYSPNVSVLHMQGVSTSKRISSLKEKILFRFEKQTESAEKQLIERKKYNR